MAYSSFLGVLRHNGSKYLFCLLWFHTSCKIVLLIFQYCIASRVCCNRVELHCLALLLWMANCFDMVFVFICVQNKDQIEWFEVWPRSSKLEVKMVIFITACYHAFVFLMVRTIDLSLFLVILRSPKTCSQNIAFQNLSNLFKPSS